MSSAASPITIAFSFAICTLNPLECSRRGRLCSTSSGLSVQIAKLKAIVIGLAALLIAATSWAQPSTYPNRPVKMVAPFAPGGPVDVVARVLAPKLSEGLGQHFYVENHPGGSGNIGTALVA